MSGFIAHTLGSFARFTTRALESEEFAHKDGLLQRLDPRVKVIGLPALIVAAATSRRLSIILAIFVFGLLLASFSYVPLWLLARRIWIAVLIFTGAIAMPAIFVVPGQAVGRLPLLGWSITAQGLRSAAFLVSRAETAATLSVLLVLCTPWMHVLKAMRALRVPVVVVVIVAMTYRYIFLLLGNARAMFEARESRTVGVIAGRDGRRLATGTAGVLMAKTLQLSDDVFLAMQSRGYTGEVQVLATVEMSVWDYISLAVLFSLAAIALWLGR